jgi:hypothetical protein
VNSTVSDGLPGRKQPASRLSPNPELDQRGRPSKLLSGCFPSEHNSTTQMNHDMDAGAPSSPHLRVRRAIVFATGDGRGRGRARQGKARQSKADGRAATGGLGHPSVECSWGNAATCFVCLGWAVAPGEGSIPARESSCGIALPESVGLGCVESRLVGTSLPRPCWNRRATGTGNGEEPGRLQTNGWYAALRGRGGGEGQHGLLIHDSIIVDEWAQEGRGEGGWFGTVWDG